MGDCSANPPTEIKYVVNSANREHVKLGINVVTMKYETNIDHLKIDFLNMFCPVTHGFQTTHTGYK